MAEICIPMHLLGMDVETKINVVTLCEATRVVL